MRRLFPLVAALALIAPSCPQYGPSDYDPDAVRPFPVQDARTDLVYVAGSSAKGDVVYVVSMPSGEILTRIDGPDARTGWAFAPDDVAYYAVTSYSGPTTIHRLHLRTGLTERVISDPRLPGQGFDLSGGVRTSLALSQSGTAIFVARVLAEGPQAWVGRYDVATGALTSERAWPLDGTGGALRFAAAGQHFILVDFTTDEGGRPKNQRLHVLDVELNELASAAKADGLADNEACAARFERLADGGWVSVCFWNGWRYATVLRLDDSFGVRSHSSVPIDAGENVIAWAADGDNVGLMTDRARSVRVASDGSITSTWLADATDGTHVRIALEIAPGLLAAFWISPADTQVTQELVVLDVRRGAIVSRSDGVGFGGLNIAGTRDRYYAVRHDPGGPQLWRVDLPSFTLVGNGVPLPARDGVSPGGPILVVPATR